MGLSSSVLSYVRSLFCGLFQSHGDLESLCLLHSTHYLAARSSLFHKQYPYFTRRSCKLGHISQRNPLTFSEPALLYHCLAGNIIITFHIGRSHCNVSDFARRLSSPRCLGSKPTNPLPHLLEDRSTPSPASAVCRCSHSFQK